MVFTRVPLDTIVIDGISYEVTNSSNQDHFDCKDKFLNIIRHLEMGYDDDYLTAETLSSFKKEMISKLKDFEKKYVKHVKAKSTNEALADIHKKAMQPTIDLTEANYNLYHFRKLSETREFPEFRKKALVEKYIDHMTKVCCILKAFPNKDTKTLDQEYDIRHIIEILDLPGWKDCPPFAFYLNPMQDAWDALTKELLQMHTDGPLRISYYVERNYEMTVKTMDLVRHYNIVRVLLGDELKRDQFKFIYNMHEKVYLSALKDIYLNPKQHTAVM